MEMNPVLATQKIEAAFQSRPDIIAAIHTCADSPGRIALLNEIAGHVCDLLQSDESREPEQKKRKLAVDQQSSRASDQRASIPPAADEAILLEVKEISCAVPQRKKLDLCFTENYLYARAPGLMAPIPTITYPWKEFEYAFYLPIPDKAQAQHYYILFPKDTYLTSKANPQLSIEPLVFMAPSTPLKSGTIGGSDSNAASAMGKSYSTVFHWAFARYFKSADNPVDIVSADASDFQGVNRQTHRPKGKVFHVNGFRGSKDGYLFFLENGIFWGFKKPLIFIPMCRIAAISYTNILQFTFNMVVEIFHSEDGETEELEFGMLDQQNYRDIDDYVRSNRLQDRSMAEQRKAKMQLAENKGSKRKQQSPDPNSGIDAVVDVDGPDEALTELERAQLEAERKLQDEEDEGEEDYDPGSDGESDGSGSSTEGEGSDDECFKEDKGLGEGGEEEEEEEGEEEEEEEEQEEQEAAAVNVGEGEEEAEEDEDQGEAQAMEAKAVPLQLSDTTSKREPPKIPVRTGWASLNASAAVGDIDMEEKFDVVG